MVDEDLIDALNRAYPWLESLTTKEWDDDSERLAAFNDLLKAYYVLQEEFLKHKFNEKPIWEIFNHYNLPWTLTKNNNVRGFEYAVLDCYNNIIFEGVSEQTAKSLLFASNHFYKEG